jgi:hypothetical protein
MLLDRLESDLRQLVDPKTALPAIDRIVRTCDAFGCGTDHPLPELIVGRSGADQPMEDAGFGTRFARKADAPDRP